REGCPETRSTPARPDTRSAGRRGRRAAVCGFRRSLLQPSREPVRYRQKCVTDLFEDERNGVGAVERVAVREFDSCDVVIVYRRFANGANGSNVPDDDGHRQSGFVADDFEEWEAAHREPSPRSNNSCTLTLRPRMRRAARVRWSIVESLGSAVPSLSRSKCG